jgi:predicted nucleic acid-binding protein
VAAVTRYTVDGVAMARYLVDQLPPAADEVFERSERGVDVIESPTVAVSEAIWTAVNKRTIAGVEVETTPNAVLRGLVNDGPVQVAPTDEQDLAVYGSLIDHHTLHDALLIANHRVRGTEALVTNDDGFPGEDIVWR